MSNAPLYFFFCNRNHVSKLKRTTRGTMVSTCGEYMCYGHGLAKSPDALAGSSIFTFSDTDKAIVETVRKACISARKVLWEDTLN